MDKISIIKNYKDFKEKNNDYYVFSGLLNCLTPQELIKSFDYGFNLAKLKRKLYIYKIASDIKNNIQEYNNFFTNLLKNIRSLNSYHKKQACSQFLSELYEYFPLDLKNKLLEYLLFSTYTNDRIRGYNILFTYWTDSFKIILDKAFSKHSDLEALEIVIDKMPPLYLSSNYNTICDFFQDEDLQWDFDLLKLRNKFLIKIFSFLKKDIILNLRKKDPISYIFIMKENGKKVDEDFAYDTFLNTQRKSLITWYGQMGLWNTIMKINKYISGNSDNDKFGMRHKTPEVTYP